MNFYTWAILTKKENKELIEKTKKIQVAASRKQKRVPKKSLQLVEAVLESLEQAGGGGSRATRLQTAKQPRRSSSIIEVGMEEEGLKDFENSNSSDASDCIVIVYDN
jgi:hypothetical protein